MNFSIKLSLGIPDITISVTCHVNNHPKHNEHPLERDYQKTWRRLHPLCVLQIIIINNNDNNKKNCIDLQSAQEACNLDSKHVYQMHQEDLATLLCDVTGPSAYNTKSNCCYFCGKQRLRYQYLAGFFSFFCSNHALVNFNEHQRCMLLVWIPLIFSM